MAVARPCLRVILPAGAVLALGGFCAGCVFFVLVVLAPGAEAAESVTSAPPPRNSCPTVPAVSCMSLGMVLLRVPPAIICPTGEQSKSYDTNLLPTLKSMLLMVNGMSFCKAALGLINLVLASSVMVLLLIKLPAMS